MMGGITKFLVLLGPSLTLALTIPEKRSVHETQHNASSTASSELGSPLSAPSLTASHASRLLSLNSTSSNITTVGAFLNDPIFTDTIDLCLFGYLHCPDLDDDLGTDGPTIDQNGTTTSRKRSHHARQNLMKRAKGGYNPFPGRTDLDFWIQPVNYRSSALQFKGLLADYKTVFDAGNKWTDTGITETGDTKRTWDKATEHPWERRTSAWVLNYIAGGDSTLQDSLHTAWNTEIDPKLYKWIKDTFPWGDQLTKLTKGTLTVGQLYMHTFGSTTNDGILPLAKQTVDGAKEGVFSPDDYIEPGEFQKFVQDYLDGKSSPKAWRTGLADMQRAFNYMNKDEMTARYMIISQWQMKVLENFPKLAGIEIKRGDGSEVQWRDLYTRWVPTVRETIVKENTAWFKDQVQFTIDKHDDKLKDLKKLADNLVNIKLTDERKAELQKDIARTKDQFGKVDARLKAVITEMNARDAKAEMEQSAATVKKARNEVITEAGSWQDLTTEHDTLSKSWRGLADEYYQAEMENLLATPEGVEKYMGALREDGKVLNKWLDQVSETFQMPDWLAEPNDAQLEAIDQLDALDKKEFKNDIKAYDRASSLCRRGESCGVGPEDDAPDRIPHTEDLTPTRPDNEDEPRPLDDSHTELPPEIPDAPEQVDPTRHGV